MGLKKAFLLAATAAVFAFSGCASFWKTLGVATVASVDEKSAQSGQDAQALREENEALKAKVAELESTVSRLTASVEKLEDSSDEVARLEDLVADLEDRIDLIPQETLKKIADILSRAARTEGTSRAEPAEPAK